MCKIQRTTKGNKDRKFRIPKVLLKEKTPLKEERETIVLALGIGNKNYGKLKTSVFIEKPKVS